MLNGIVNRTGKGLLNEEQDGLNRFEKIMVQSIKDQRETVNNIFDENNHFGPSLELSLLQ